MEYEVANTTGHHHANKEIQILEVNPENTAESYRITVENPHGGQYQVKFINPNYDPSARNSIQVWTSDKITDNGDGWHVRRRIVGYYWSVYGSNIEVIRTRYDADDVETTSSSATVKIIYTVTLLKQINGASFASAAIVSASGLTATVSIAAPHASSTPPLAGHFFIKCPNSDGSEFQTRDFSYNNWVEGLDFYSQLEIPHLQFKTHMRDTGKYAYRENGVSFFIVFQDYHGDVPQCTIESSATTPLTGNNIVHNSTTFREYG